MNASETPASSPSDAPKKPSSGRMLLLLGVLAIMIGALTYDRMYAGPGKEAAKDRIDEAVESKVFAGVTETASTKDKSQLLPTDKDIQEAIGFAPKWTKKEGEYTLQCYHWWGPIPLNRNYLIVRYRGTDPLLYVDYGDGQTPGGSNSSTIEVSPATAPAPGPTSVAEGSKQPGDAAPSAEEEKTPAADTPDEPKAEAKAEPKAEAKAEEAAKPADE